LKVKEKKQISPEEIKSFRGNCLLGTPSPISWKQRKRVKMEVFFSIHEGGESKKISLSVFVGKNIIRDLKRC
jgi:hypothetical protein